MQTANSKAPCVVPGQGVHLAKHGPPVVVWSDAMGAAVCDGKGGGGFGRGSRHLYGSTLAD